MASMPAPDPLYCADCGRERLPNEYACPACECAWTTPDVGGFGARAELAWSLGGPLAGALRVGPDKVVLLHGEPSGGKSSIALAALGHPLTAGELADTGRDPAPVDEPHPAGRPVVFSSSEMPAGQIRDYSGRLGYRVDRITTPRIEDRTPGTGEECGRLLGIGTDWLGADLILDSVTELPSPLAAMLAVRRYVRHYGARALVIAQDTKDGDVRGSRKLVYQCDTVVKVAQGISWRTVTIGPKNRCVGGSSSVLFAIDERGRLGVPEWGSSYYVVDGKAPTYRLLQWPSPEAGNLADPLRAAEKGRLVLPPPPCAVAASRSDLYPGGWAVPDDAARRRAFVERVGLPFADPSTFRSRGE